MNRLMKHYRVIVLIAALWAIVPLPLFISACHAPVSVVTPAGQAAFSANEVLIRVERLQDAAIAANKNGSLPTETARAIVFTTVQLAELADAATQGWEATARQAWTQAKKELPALQAGGPFAVLVAAIDEVFGGAA